MLIITGRLKDVIIRKGENISAKEVEDQLYQHPKVGDVAVIGLPDERGASWCAPSSSPPRARSPSRWPRWPSYLKGAGLMMQKIPERLEFIDVLPRNPRARC